MMKPQASRGPTRKSQPRRSTCSDSPGGEGSKTFEVSREGAPRRAWTAVHRRVIGESTKPFLTGPSTGPRRRRVGESRGRPTGTRRRAAGPEGLGAGGGPEVVAAQRTVLVVSKRKSNRDPASSSRAAPGRMAERSTGPSTSTTGSSTRRPYESCESGRPSSFRRRVRAAARPDNIPVPAALRARLGTRLRCLGCSSTRRRGWSSFETLRDLTSTTGLGSRFETFR